nr:hypothetical protein [Tanacetum cinerariifolium]
MAQQVIPAAQLVTRFHTIERCNNYVATLLWCDFINNVNQKKEAIQYPRFIKHIIVDLIKKFLDIPQRIEEDYHSIKDDIPLVSVYTNRNVLVRGMLIPDAFLTEEIHATDDFKEYEMVFMNVDVLMNQPQPIISTQGTCRSTPRAHRTPILSAKGKKRKQSARESSSPRKSLKITIRQQKVVEGNKDDDDSEDRLEPESHKDKPEHLDDDDKDDENVDEEERETVPLPTTTTSKNLHSKRQISNKYNHLPCALRMMCRRQREDEIHSHHDDHQKEDASFKEEKIVKRHKASKVQSLIKATLNDVLSNQFKNAKKYAYHLEQITNFMENQIVWKSRQEDIRRLVPKPRVFFGPQRNLNEPPRYLYNKDMFFLKYGNNEEKKYILSLHKIHAEQFPEVDLEEKMNRIEAHEPYSIVDKPSTGVIYLSSKDEKRVMYLTKIVKFYDATLEKV